MPEDIQSCTRSDGMRGDMKRKLSRTESIMVTGFIVVGVANIVGAVFITRELARANRTLDHAEESITTAADSVTKVFHNFR